MSYKIRASGKRAELYLYDAIGEDIFGGISAQRVVDDVRSLGKVDLINVRINSPGGEVFNGITIYNVLKNHPARIEVDIDGLAASIASIIAMAGDQIRMAKNAMMMVHGANSIAFGTAEDLRKKADLMDQVNENLIQTYVDRTGLEHGKVESMLDEETWMRSDEAMRLGFIDEITEELQMAASVDRAWFKKPPKSTQRMPAPPSNAFRARIAANAQRAQRILGS